ncbi:MAG TPA: MotA/TolQ/ExbB proton channel family protein [Microbacteriaceae bacterium]|nr:MotA/TolQ/ExbB proton channel family protein [Microbacteriaceae bacterium]
MDLATIVGLLAAFGSLAATIFIEGSDPSSLLLPGPLILVFGGTIGVGIAGATMHDTIAAFKLVPAAFRGRRPDMAGTIAALVRLADLVRHDGLLALDSAAEEIDDPFLKTAMQGVADGADSDDLATRLQDEIDTRAAGLRRGAKFFGVLGGYAPTVGIIGTVVSLTHVLAHLSSPNALGPMIASAFIATLWGLLSANFIWLPIGSRIGRLCDLEVERQNLVLEGVLAIQAGVSSRALAERLAVLVPAETGKGGDKEKKDKDGKGGEAPERGAKAKGRGTKAERKESVNA